VCLLAFAFFETVPSAEKYADKYPFIKLIDAVFKNSLYPFLNFLFNL
jgi:hypothetical protein